MLNLTQSIASGDTPAGLCASGLGDIEDLVQTHKSYILRLAWMKLRDLDLAESVTQDCFLRAFRARSLYRGECSVRTWLSTIAMHLIIDASRSKEKRFWKGVAASAIDISDAHDTTPGHQLSPEAHILLREQLATIWDLVDDLSKAQRETFLLRFACEMELHEISELMDMNLSTVKSNLHRGLRVVRSRLHESGGPHLSRNKAAVLKSKKIQSPKLANAHCLE